MRYLGNKTRLIPFILRALERLGVEPGVACDPFAGTASVACGLKRAGWRVHAGDIMAASYALQVARVELDRTPRFPARLLPAADRNGATTISYRKLLAWLSAAEGEPGFITEHYTLEGEAGREHGRMYFSPENGRRIDLVRKAIEEWLDAGLLDRPRAQLLIATLVEAADRVANTTGVYASFVKTLQPNARRPLELRPLIPARTASGTGSSRAAGPSSAFRGRAAGRLRGVGTVDLVYLDPPYNGRQYPGYYHIPELIATGWFPAPEIRGKTGLIPDEDLRSDWCRRRRAPAALREVLEAADTRHVLFSYNDEGILEREEIEAALRERGDPDSYQLLTQHYRRYRSDADGPRRTYLRDRVREHLHYVRCG